jgi:hypothetical protein
MVKNHEKEKRFEIGQRVRIIGPVKYGYSVHIGKCFVIGDKELHGEYSTPGCHHAWPASSLELTEPEYVADGQMVKIVTDRVFHLQTSGEFAAIRGISLTGKPIDAVGL